MYIDSTEDMCEENAEILFHSTHQHQNDCCTHKAEEKSCCEHHNSSFKTVKLKNDYNYSNRQVPPKPSILSLLIDINAPHQIDILHSSLFDDGLLRELPPEIPLLQHSGREIITLHHTFKIAC
uniref:hypothetical protein n=1 Tax=Labilibacter marinus TaxID=1477105 RepID=UPI001179DD49|nr:hypothetical protein [Labilibacter marinus]